MSDWKTKSLEVVREGQPAPYYEPTLAPVPPRKRGCVGEECPYLETRDCGPTRHHIFFEHLAHLALGYPYNELVNDRHSIITMARCRHNSVHPTAWHNLYKYTRLMREEAAVRWLEESNTLTRLEVLLNDMSQQINSIYDDRLVSRVRTFGEGVFQERLERFEEGAVEYSGMVEDVAGIEVIPATIVGSVVTDLGTRRNMLRSRAAEVPDFAKVQIARLPGGAVSTGSLQTPAEGLVA